MKKLFYTVSAALVLFLVLFFTVYHMQESLIFYPEKLSSDFIFTILFLTVIDQPISH